MERSTRLVGQRAGVGADAGAERSFEQFFADEYRRVVGLAAALCGRPSIAEELAQDAFVKAFGRWDRICRYDDPAAWVRRDESSTSAIAAVLNIAESTVRVHLHNARRKLATVLSEDLDEEPT